MKNEGSANLSKIIMSFYSLDNIWIVLERVVRFFLCLPFEFLCIFISKNYFDLDKNIDGIKQEKHRFLPTLASRLDFTPIYSKKLLATGRSYEVDFRSSLVMAGMHVEGLAHFLLFD